MNDADRLAQAITRKLRGGIDQFGGQSLLGMIRDTSPLAVELVTARLTLDEDDLVMGQWVRKYDLDYGLAVGDGVLLLPLATGDFAVVDVISEVPTLPGSVPDGSITTLKLADNAVTNPKLADNAVNSAEIVDDAVGSNKIAPLAVGTSRIADVAITDPKVASGSLEGRRLNWHEGATPPGSPQVNDLWLFHPAVGVSWLFRYEPDQDATYPWQYVGGREWAVNLVGGVRNTVFNTWQSLGGPSMTVPRNGVYTLRVESAIENLQATWVKMHFGWFLSGSSLGVYAYGDANSAAGHGGTHSISWPATLTISNVWEIQYHTTDISGGTALANTTYFWRSMGLEPFRVN